MDHSSGMFRAVERGVGQGGHKARLWRQVRVLHEGVDGRVASTRGLVGRVTCSGNVDDDAAVVAGPPLIDGVQGPGSDVVMESARN